MVTERASDSCYSCISLVLSLSILWCSSTQYERFGTPLDLVILALNILRLRDLDGTEARHAQTLDIFRADLALQSRKVRESVLREVHAELSALWSHSLA